jgi:hypothetical protein
MKIVEKSGALNQTPRVNTHIEYENWKTKIPTSEERMMGKNTLTTWYQLIRLMSLLRLTWR